jgi:hypothetical protein
MIRTAGLITLVGLLAACSSSPAPAPDAPAAVGTASGVLVSPLQSPLNAQADTVMAAAAGTPIPPVIVPTASADKGVLTGVLIDVQTGAPVRNSPIYLGGLLKMQDDKQNEAPDYLIRLDPKLSPLTVTDGDGRFAFGNLPPEEYVIILWTPQKSTFVADTANPQKERILDIKAGQVVDIGTVQVTLP